METLTWRKRALRKRNHRPKLKDAVAALHEILTYVENYSHGIAMDVKDTARIALYGSLRAPTAHGCECKRSFK